MHCRSVDINWTITHSLSVEILLRTRVLICIEMYLKMFRCYFVSGGAALGKGPGRAGDAADAGHDRPPDL